MQRYREGGAQRVRPTLIRSTPRLLVAAVPSLPTRAPDRVLVATAAGIGLFAGWSVGTRTHLFWLGTLALVALSLMILYLSLPPHVLLICWLFVAPLLQESARQTRIGWMLYSILYVLPIGAFLLHTATSNTIARRLRWFDVLPLGYLLFIITSQAVVGASVLTTASFYTDLVHAGVLVGVPLYYFCVFGPLDRLSTQRLSAAVLAGSSLVGAMGIVEHYAQWNLWGQASIGQPPRIVSTLAQPGVLGAFLGAGIVLATSVLAWNGPRSLRSLSVVTLVVTAPALFFTYTRGGILATVTIATFVIAAKPRMRLVAAGVATVIGILIVANWSTISSNSLYQNRAADTVNVRSRLLLSGASLHLAAQRPIVGWGYGRFDTAKNAQSFNTGDLPTRELYGYTSHNTYLTILVELGGVGFALFVLPWAIVVGGTLRRLRSTTRSRWFTIALLGILGVIAFTALTTDMRFFSFVPALAWITLGTLRRRLSDDLSSN
jgi:O-antigen ligase